MQIGGFFMDNYTEKLKLFFSTVMASGVSLFGSSFKYIIVLVFLLIVDTIFGWIKSKKLNQWKLSSARSGFIGKIIELIFIGVLYLLDWIFQIDFLKYMGIFYFGICEIASIIDNYSAINGNLPEGISEIVNKIKLGIGNFAVSKIRTFFERFFDFKDKK